MVMDHRRVRSLTLQSRATISCQLSVVGCQLDHPDLRLVRKPKTENFTPIGPTPESQATAPGLRGYAPATATRMLLVLMLTTVGCQSVVDPGRSMRPVPAPVSPGVITPSGPAFPSTPLPQDSAAGVERQPATTVLQLPHASAKESKYHTVKAGDSWTSVARQYQLTVPELTDANGIDLSTVLQPGQMIYIPEK